MLKFASQIAMMLSLGTILYIAARTLPRINDEAIKGLAVQTDWIAERIEALDERLKKIWEKTLRRVSVTLSKLQNKTHTRLTKLKKENDTPTDNFFSLDKTKKTEDTKKR
jgi:DNA-binding ferritin-like protein